MVERAVRAGCEIEAIGGDQCSFPACDCKKFPRAIRAALSADRREITKEMIERGARGIYDVDPFYLPTGQIIDGMDIAKKFPFDDAPSYRQERARELARAALTAGLAEEKA